MKQLLDMVLNLFWGNRLFDPEDFFLTFWIANSSVATRSCPNLTLQHSPNMSFGKKSFWIYSMGYEGLPPLSNPWGYEGLAPLYNAWGYEGLGHILRHVWSSNTITVHDNIYAHHIYMSIIYDQHIWSPYIIIIHDHHIYIYMMLWSSYMIIIDDHHT